VAVRSPQPFGGTAELEAENARLRAELGGIEAELERLRQSEKMYRFAAEIGAHLVWVADARGEITEMSKAFRNLTGLPEERGLGAGWMEFVHPDDRERVNDAFAASIASGEPFVAEFRACVADGSYRTAVSKALPARDAEGLIRCWYGSTQDVHDARAAEQALRDAEQRYRLAVRATSDAVWDHDLVNGTIDWSENTSGIFGTDLPLGRTSTGWWEERIHPEDKLPTLASLSDAIEGDETRWSATYRFLKDDGSYADMLDRGFKDGRAVRAVGAMADLTHRHQAEAEIRRMEAELIHVSRLSAMGTMASTLAHELNQPLTAAANFISGARRLATNVPDQPADLLEALQAAEGSARRAGEIVRRLRDLVSRGTVATAVEHLPRLIEEAGVLAFLDGESLGIAHRVSLDPAAKWVQVDRVQIQQVLINLIRNSVDAMAQSERREILISTRAVPGELVEIQVADTGTGIAAGHLDRLFSQFMTTKRNGMGIGLPISRTIVEAHGGTIWGENRPGGGAVFSFTLPRARKGRDRAGRAAGE
jgi:two-component system sensor kinase FixL